VPKEPPKKQEKPPPIFPWEEREVPKPTRKFIEDEPQLPPPPEPELEPEIGASDEFEVKSDVEPTTPAVDRTPWDAFGAVNKNAWDEVSGIENYVRALTAFQKNRGKVQVLQHSPTSPSAQEQQHVLSPTNEPNPEELVEKVAKRRESLLLTDFPSAIERPSLPVTPAPVRRSSFWGPERDEEGELPPAEGVPDQADWVCPNCGFILPPPPPAALKRVVKALLEH
jgi:glycogenin glucosyltransferase